MISLGYTIANKSEKKVIGFQRHVEKISTPDELITDDGEAHLLTIAPTGAGKGRSNVIPTSLEYPGSMIILDTKGEDAVVT